MLTVEKMTYVLGQPYFINDWVVLFNQDCSQAMSLLADAGIEVDSTITSPPYNIGKEYEKSLSLKEYVDWLASVSDLVHDLTAMNGSFLLNLGYLNIENRARAVPIPYLIWQKIRFFLNQEIVWNYGAGVACKNYLSPRNEKILWYVKDPENYVFNLDDIRDPDVKYPNSKKNGRLRTNTLGKNPSDVWQIAKVTSGADRSAEERTAHPAQFPEDLVTRMILGFTNPGDLILDPFLGSGTTAVVAMKNKRYCLGFEINEEYCKTAVRRIKQAELAIQANSLTLF